MSEKIRAVLYDPRTEKATEIQVGGIHDYYKYLECDLFDIVSMNRGELSIYVDDEGLLKDGLLTTFILGYGPLVGNLIFTGGAGPLGETLPLPDKYTVEVIEAMCVVPI